MPLFFMVFAPMSTAIPGQSPVQLPEPPASLRSSQWFDLVWWLLRRRKRLRVAGESMSPLLQPGQEILINPYAYRHTRPQPGDLVVALHPLQPDLTLIKWMVYGDEQGCFLKGINSAASTDSRAFGLVAWNSILGQVVCRFP